jgi:hypothetical protein
VDAQKERYIIYAVLGVVFIGLAIWGVAAYSSQRASKEADEKADTLLQKFDKAGLPELDKDQVVQQFGTDGGAVCESPVGSLAKALLKQNLSNGAGGPGQRPIISDRDVLEGQLLVVSTYCPEKAPKVSSLINDFHFDDVIKGE